MPLLLVLSDWTGCVVGNLRSHGFDFILNGIKVPMDDARKTNAYHIPLSDPPISIGRYPIFRTPSLILLS